MQDENSSKPIFDTTPKTNAFGGLMNICKFFSAGVAFTALAACGGTHQSDNAASTRSSSTSSSSSSSSSSGDTMQGGVSIYTDLPAEMRISDDGERLERGGFYTSEFYDDTQVETLYLDFEQSDYWDQLDQNYSSKTEIPATLRYKGEVLEQVGVRFRGNTSYSRANEKKSFSIDLEWAIDGQDINGYNEIKLNNAFEDPSSMREVLYTNLARKNIPSAKGNFVNLIINGENFGIYANLQKLDKDHVKEWFLDKDATRWRAEAPPGGGGFGGNFSGFGAGISSLNDLGENGSDYEKAYTLKSSDVDDPWQDLANAAHTLGVASPDYLIEELSQYLDIDGSLWFLATENIFTDDDGYIRKGGMDYYVYYDIATGRILPIEYDGNTAISTRLATSWDPLFNTRESALPLLNVLLNIPELRQRYLAHYRVLMEDAIKPSIAHKKIEAYAQLIDTYIASPDAVRMHSYSEYIAELQIIKSFFSTRYEYLQNHRDIARDEVMIDAVEDSVAGQPSVRPKDDQSVVVSARIGGDVAARAVSLYYGSGLMGNFTKVPMMEPDDGEEYSAAIPPYPKGTYVRYYVEAIANDSAGTASYNPKGAEHDVYIYQVQAADTITSPVVINEIMASNSSTAIDEEGEYGDWIELYNNSDQAVNLTGWYLTDEDTNLQRWPFPQGTIIDANSILVIWADDKAALTTGLHANFKLSASGENVFLVNPDSKFADKLTYERAETDASFARMPNGSGKFTWTTSSSFGARNE